MSVLAMHSTLRASALVLACFAAASCRTGSSSHETPGGSQLRVLAVAPLVGRPTATSAILRVVNGEEPATVRVAPAGHETLEAELRPWATYDFVVDGLESGEETAYELVAESGGLADTVRGRLVTRPPPGSGFTFAVLADPHLPIPALDWIEPEDEDEARKWLGFQSFRAEVGEVFRQAMTAIDEAGPDFVVCLGDMFTITDSEFNPPFPTAALAEAAYLDFRDHLGEATARASFFAVVGNWDGENGWHPEALREHARTARRKYLPNPGPDTYPEGGGRYEDYYAWTWGDALLVVLNVMGYTTTVHTLDESDDGTATSWTLGADQWSWLEKTLADATSPVKMLFIHHPVGGNGGDELSSAYGRGGGRAARVGEQERLHELMLGHGVQVLFYGHDHVFTEQVVDGVHYVLPGSAGAPWKFQTEETGYEEYDPRSGFALVRVSTIEIRIEFRDLAGETFQEIVIDR